MTSRIFQPLLYDSYGYKLPNTTYVDSYKWKKIYKKKQNKSPKEQLLSKSQNNLVLQNYIKANNDNTNNYLAASSSCCHCCHQQQNCCQHNVNFDPNVKECVVVRGTSGQERSSPSKLDPYATVNTLQFENNNIDDNLVHLGHKYIKSPSPSPSPAGIIYQRHWLTYPQEAIPKYITDAKKRLGQIHPRTPPNLKERLPVDNSNNNKNANIDHEHSAAAHQAVEDTQAIAKHLAKHFLTYDHPDTPEHIREIRKKYRDERYKREFVPLNYRSVNVTKTTKTTDNNPNNRYAYSSMRQEEFRKYLESVTAVPVNNIPTPNLQLQSTCNSPNNLKRSKSAVVYRQIQANQDPKFIELVKPEEKDNEPVNSSLATIVQYLDTTTFQNDKNQPQPPPQVIVNEVSDQEQNNDNNRPLTAQAQEWISTEWDKYYGYGRSKSRLNDENEENQESHSVQVEMKRPSTVIGLQNRKAASNSLNEKAKTETSEPMSFEEWVNIANDKEKQAVLKMLKTIDGVEKRPNSVQPAPKEQPKYNMNSVTYGYRSRPPSTPPRKLGKTRHYHKFPCAICEKTQIKKHIWEINNKKEEGYSNITGFFHNIMPTWRGQYVIHPDFSSEIKDLKRIFTVKRAQSSLK